jgi:hypothetical protein
MYVSDYEWEKMFDFLFSFDFALDFKQFHLFAFSGISSITPRGVGVTDFVMTVQPVYQ